ncbi:flagellar export chaperone FliS [Pantoea allii]|uniref:flagellar export chaperone FliS n=1 Tax=Pantoea TaxID=53335 RepID=UPI0007C7553A|nr:MULTISPECIES: flagellar export chaperone FliS [Pantoea]MBW1252898.1 flagellar export chaperone FliS [Pantoea allii]MBW1262324.1 flagellar export chaperone FliS [Pantoea allii]MBW1283453.1 flagellar export chaperone FliS [Pantoea allii]OAE08583.1 flagellar export chaperone FliS [Pantoea sp. OXWO6B1]ORM87253.1 flagellar export chaperone FliS [Pantoea allii]
MYHPEQPSLSEYQQSDLSIQAAAANPHQLVLMLFSGLMDELVRAKGHIDARRYDRKANSINKCIDILNALTSALDFDKGNELALSLANLYDYCVYRLYDASHKLSVVAIEEVELILGNIQDGWVKMGQANG